MEDLKYMASCLDILTDCEGDWIYFKPSINILQILRIKTILKRKKVLIPRDTINAIQSGFMENNCMNVVSHHHI